MFMIREILGYCIISAICLLGMAVLYAPICFLLRKRVPPAKQLAYFLFGACVIIVLAATVVVGASKTAAADRSLNLVPFKVFQETWGMPEPKKIAQTAANIVMFVPLGFMMPVAFQRMRGFGKTALSLALFSFAIEFTQYFTGRSADIDDLMLNTLGGILGYGNLRPSEQRITAGSELQRAVDTVTRREEQLELQLDEAGQKILSEMSDAQQMVDHITALENFILGFRLGAKIMLECMDSGDGDTKELIEHG